MAEQCFHIHHKVSRPLSAFPPPPPSTACTHIASKLSEIQTRTDICSQIEAADMLMDPSVQR